MDTFGFLIPIFGILLPATIVFTVFYFNYQESKNKHNALIEISKNIDDPSQLEELIKSLEDKEEPTDFRRTGVITFFTGIGIYIFGMVITEGAFWWMFLFMTLNRRRASSFFYELW